MREDLTSRRLVNVLGDWALKMGDVVAIFPSRRGLMPAMRKLIDFLAEAFEQGPVAS